MSDHNRNSKIAPLSKLWKIGLIAAVGASVANLVFFWISKGLFDIPYIIPMGGPSGPLEPLPVGAIVLFNVVPAGGATLLLALLGQYAARPIRMFWMISGVIFILSFAPPLSLPESIATSTIIGLSLMHVIAWPAIAGPLTMLGRKQ